jgi:cytochrome c oxidase subunit 2
VSILRTALGLAGALTGASTAWAAESAAGARVWLPPVVSTTGPAIDQLFYTILWITGIAFVLVQVSLVIFLLAYRRTPQRRATYIHGNTAVEIVWTVIPTIILIVLAVHSQKVWAVVRGTPPPPGLEVEITGEQFAWNVRYQGPDGLWDTPDDVTTINQLHLPVNETVLFHLKSKDVIHSFFVPQFRMKQDAVPGLTTRMWVSATRPGEFEVVCAELCGLGHYRMRGFLFIDTPEAYQAWMAEQVAAMAPPPATEAGTPPQAGSPTEVPRAEGERPPAPEVPAPTATPTEPQHP